MDKYLISLGLSLGLTLVIELVYAICVGVHKKDLLLVGMINVITNPIVVLAATLLRPVIWWIEFPLEVAVVLSEWLLLKHFSVKIDKPFALALGMNLLSYGIGLILNTIL